MNQTGSTNFGEPTTSVSSLSSELWTPTMCSGALRVLVMNDGGRSGTSYVVCDVIGVLSSLCVDGMNQQASLPYSPLYIAVYGIVDLPAILGLRPWGRRLCHSRRCS